MMRQRASPENSTKSRLAASGSGEWREGIWESLPFVVHRLPPTPSERVAILQDKPQLLLHDTAGFPWHARSFVQALAISSQCQESPRSILSGIRRVCTRTFCASAPPPFLPNRPPS